MNRMLKFVVVPLLAALVIGVLPMQLGYGQAEQKGDDQNVVNRLLGLFEKANATLYNVLLRVNQTVPLPNVVWEKYDTGLAKAKEAVQRRDAGDNTGAKAKALEAMQKIKEVMLDVADDYESIQTEDEIKALKAAGIEDAVERINATIARLEEIAENAEARGIDASQIRERLGNVTKLLTQIRERIEAGDIEEAAEKLEMSQQWFGEAMAELRPVIDANKLSQAQRFLSMTEERFTSVSTMINDVISGLPIPEIARNRITQNIGRGIKTAQTKIVEVRSLLQNGRVADAMPKLGELRADIAGLLAEAKSGLAQHKPGAGEALENIDRYEVALDVLEEKAEVLSEKGVDVSTLLSKIQAARNRLTDAVAELKKGNTYTVNTILAKIQTIVKEAMSLAK